MSELVQRLDRLSALLDGLSPSVTIRHAGTLAEPLVVAGDASGQLRLHLMLSGAARFSDASGERLLDAPEALMLPGDFGHVLRAAGDEACLLSAEFHFAGPAAGSLLAAFRQPVGLRLDDASADLVHLLALIRGEVESPRCGHRSLLTHALEILLISLLRHIIARPDISADGGGMLSALADARIARAVVAMNESAAHPWTLESLAACAGMSRTAFALAFRNKMGVTSGQYLSCLRLAIAEQSVAAGHGLKRAALAAGFASPAALSRALSRRRAVADSLVQGSRRAVG